MAEVAQDRKLESHEIERINRVNLALRFGLLPHQIDEMPAKDYFEVISVLNAQGRIEAFKAEQRRQQREIAARPKR